MAWPHRNHNKKKIGLVLTGGGAKAAFQVGVLAGISEILGQPQTTPFHIISGASAGAINGTILAAFADRFDYGVARLVETWGNFHVQQIYETHFTSLMRNTGRWLGHFLRSPGRPVKPISLLNNQPLAELLSCTVPFEQIQKNITQGVLTAVSVTAFGYSSGESISFFQATESQESWKRYRRAGVRSYLGIRHLLASSAIPVVFPAQRIHREYFGDGSIGFLSPISPALHLGADKIVVITTDPPEQVENWRHKPIHYPSFAQIGARLLDSIFTDSLASDLERLERINQTLSHIKGGFFSRHKVPLRHVDYLKFEPEINIAELANKAFDALPSLLKFFLRRAGMDRHHGGEILAFLVFEDVFTRVLIDHGKQQAYAQKDQILNFFEER
ncbi:MAG: patatin-like phospholipase family protein [Gammaproteobacteria bacterium]|nr:MAG: patatin-like phospholipase family protein [Gammaproteobacteria bacterium]